LPKIRQFLEFLYFAAEDDDDDNETGDKNHISRSKPQPFMLPSALDAEHEYGF
jgi:hypothetical protein